jgi:hypothetical protein
VISVPSAFWPPNAFTAALAFSIALDVQALAFPVFTAFRAAADQCMAEENHSRRGLANDEAQGISRPRSGPQNWSAAPPGQLLSAAAAKRPEQAAHDGHDEPDFDELPDETNHGVEHREGDDDADNADPDDEGTIEDPKP